jgi:hypothetical protein
MTLTGGLHPSFKIIPVLTAGQISDFIGEIGDLAFKNHFTIAILRSVLKANFLCTKYAKNQHFEQL